MADKVKMPVEGSHIMMFARSLLDDNPIYSDAEYAAKSEAGSVIAPPTFGRAVAHDVAVRPRWSYRCFDGMRPTIWPRRCLRGNDLYAWRLADI